MKGGPQKSQEAGLEHCRGYVEGMGAGQIQSPSGLKDMTEHLSMTDLKLLGSQIGDTAQNTAAAEQRRL